MFVMCKPFIYDCLFSLYYYSMLFMVLILKHTEIFLHVRSLKFVKRRPLNYSSMSYQRVLRTSHIDDELIYITDYCSSITQIMVQCLITVITRPLHIEYPSTSYINDLHENRSVMIAPLLHTNYRSLHQRSHDHHKLMVTCPSHFDVPYQLIFSHPSHANS